MSDKLYFKQKVESKLGKKINMDVDWEKVYEHLDIYINSIDPISYATENNKTDLVVVLLSCGYNPTLHYNNALFTAVYNNNLNIVKLILSEKITLSTDDVSALFNEAVKKNNGPLAELLIQYTNIINTDNTAIVLASSQGADDVVKVLLKDSRVDPTVNKNISIIKAVKNHHFNTVKILLENNNVDAGTLNNEAIKITIRENNINIFDLLTNHPGINLAKNENELIILASQLGRSEHIEHLLNHQEIDPSVNNNTPLMVACCNGHYDCVKTLLRHPKVNPNENMIEFTREKGYLDIVDLLTRGRTGKNSKGEYSILNQTSLFKHRIKDTLSGLVAGYYLANYIHSGIKSLKGNWIKDLYDYPEYKDYEVNSENNIQADMFCHYLTVDLITNKNAVIPKIKKFVNDWPDVEESINKAVISVHDPEKIILNSSDYLYGSIRGLLLLCYYPSYNLTEILEMLKKEGNIQKALILSGKFLGAYLGLEKLIEHGFLLDNTLERYINKVLNRDITILMAQSSSS